VRSRLGERVLISSEPCAWSEQKLTSGRNFKTDGTTFAGSYDPRSGAYGRSCAVWSILGRRGREKAHEGVQTTLSYAGLAKRAEFYGYAPSGTLTGYRGWKKLEEELYGEPVYKRIMRARQAKRR
jgi:hypothetical protein